MHWFVAYIDPGAGSLIVQATIATIVAVPYFLRRHVSRVIRLVVRRPVPSVPTASQVDRAG